MKKGTSAKIRTAPRKLASQKRSRITVDLLLAATARVLVRDGYDTASTNRIASEAGVSIGSLYQYFPSKDALVAAVIDLHIEEMMSVVRMALVDVTDQPIDAAVRRMVTVMIDAHRINPQLHRVLYDQVARVGRLENVDAVDREAYTLVRAYLEMHRNILAVSDLDMAAFMCVKTVESLTHNAVINRSDVLAGAANNHFVDEVTRLLSSYLLGH